MSLIIYYNKYYAAECSDGYTDGSVKLVKNQNSSFIQVCVGNTWADVCMEIMTERLSEDNIITTVSTVACREIRYTNGSKIFCNII